MLLAIRLCFISLCFVFFSFSLINIDEINKPGNVIYEFKTGVMQCRSEIDATGQIAILYKSLRKNTSVEFVRVGIETNPRTKKQEEAAVFIIRVEAENPPCLSWADIQEIIIEIHPESVEKISFSGKTVFENERFHVMTSL